MTEAAEAERRDWRYGSIAFVVALLLLVAAAAVPLKYHRDGLYAKSADESARTLEAWNLNLERATRYVGPWLPLHTMLTARVLEVWPDLFLAPRALSMVLGVLLVAALAWLAAELFRRRGAALLTMGLAAFFGPRVVLAAIPLSETLYMLLLTLGMAALARWLRLTRQRWLVFAALFIGLSAGVRYEGWLFAVLTFCFAALWLHFEGGTPRIRRAAALSVAAILLAAAPVAWCVTWHRAHGAAFGFFEFSGDRYFRVANPERAFRLLWEHGVIFQFWRQNLVTLNLIGAAGVLLFIARARRAAWWLVIPGMAFLLLGAFTLTGRALPTHNFWRIAAPFSVLLLPFTAHAVLAAAQALGAKWRPARPALITASVVVLFIAFHFHCFGLSQGSQMDGHDLEAARFVETQLEAHDTPAAARVFIVDSDIRWLNVRVASQYPGNFLPAAPIESVLEDGLLDISALRAKGVAVLILRAGSAAKVPRIEVFSAADKNDRWVMLALVPE